MDKNKLALTLIISLAGACSVESNMNSALNAEPSVDTVATADKKYQTFCDFAIPLVEASCQHDAGCGFFSTDQAALDGCFESYSVLVALRCHATLELPDAHYDSCLERFETLECSDLAGDLPSDCGFFE